MTRFVLIRWVAAAVTAVLWGCGGGGGGSSGTQPLVIAAASPSAGATGVAYSGYTFTASGGAPPLSWTESGPLPPGLTLSASGQLSGNPATAGTYPISVTVTDSSMPPLTASAPVSLKVNDSTIVIAAAPAPPAGTVAYPYPAFGFTASGGSPPYTWKASGTVPPGLTVGPDGTVSGTPTAAGSFSFSVTATDSAQTPVSGPPLSTQIMISNPGQLVLNPMPAPPAGTAGSGYGFNFSATGGYPPLGWSVTAGSLPVGLTLDPASGSLSGTPAQVGSFTFTVTVKDSSSTPEVSFQQFMIMVAAPPPPTIVNSEPPTGTVGAVYAQFQFSANGGLAPLVWTKTGDALPGLSLSSDGVLSGTPTAAGKFSIKLDVTDALSQVAPSVPLIVRVSLARAGAFTLTGSMVVPRSGHTATLLNTGNVLVTGGAQNNTNPPAELYDPMTGAFAETGSMSENRAGHTATLLAVAAVPNFGKVLIVGSVDTTAELYDPATGTFKATGSVTHARTSPTATLLQTGSAMLGSVLIVGGNTVAGDLAAELYNPAMGTFTATGSTIVPRGGHTATQLQDGRVLIAGGVGTASAELYNPVSGTFALTGSMTIARTGATATRLQDGTVLVFGPDGSADVYDPKAETFAAVGSNPLPATEQTASLRNDGSVLAAGGVHSFPFRGVGIVHNSVSSAALFAPESDGFTPTASLNTGRSGHTATVLSNGTVLIAGGTHYTLFCSPPPRFSCRQGPTTILSSAELFK